MKVTDVSVQMRKFSTCPFCPNMGGICSICRCIDPQLRASWLSRSQPSFPSTFGCGARWSSLTERSRLHDGWKHLSTFCAAALTRPPPPVEGNLQLVGRDEAVINSCAALHFFDKTKRSSPAFSPILSCSWSVRVRHINNAVYLFIDHLVSHQAPSRSHKERGGLCAILVLAGHLIDLLKQACQTKLTGFFPNIFTK